MRPSGLIMREWKAIESDNEDVLSVQKFACLRLFYDIPELLAEVAQLQSQLAVAHGNIERLEVYAEQMRSQLIMEFSPYRNDPGMDM